SSEPQGYGLQMERLHGLRAAIRLDPHLFEPLGHDLVALDTGNLAVDLDAQRLAQWSERQIDVLLSGPDGHDLLAVEHIVALLDGGEGGSWEVGLTFLRCHLSSFIRGIT